MEAALRVAAFQREPKYDDIPGIIERTHSDLEWCEAQGVDLAIFPECYLQGYATELTRIEQRALSTDDLIVKQMLERFSSIRATVILGIVERRDTKFYNSAMVSAGVVGKISGYHANEMSYGCTCIVRPDGEVVARVTELREGVAMFDLS